METIYSPVNTHERQKIDMRVGDTVRVWQKIEEKGKTRLQAFEGLLIARKHGKEAGATFTVRKIASGVGVEKIFPLHSPIIDRIEVVRRAKVRRSKLYYIREKSARQIRRKMKGLAAFLPIDYKEEVLPTQEELDAKAEKESEAPEAPQEETSKETKAQDEQEKEAPEEKKEDTPQTEADPKEQPMDAEKKEEGNNEDDIKKEEK